MRLGSGAIVKAHRCFIYAFVWVDVSMYIYIFIYVSILKRLRCRFWLFACLLVCVPPAPPAQILAVTSFFHSSQSPIATHNRLSVWWHAMVEACGTYGVAGAYASACFTVIFYTCKCVCTRYQPTSATSTPIRCATRYCYPLYIYLYTHPYLYKYPIFIFLYC